MIIKSISHEYRRRAAASRAVAKQRGDLLPLDCTTAKAQSMHVVAASNYIMSPTKAGHTTLGIDGHLAMRTSDYMVGKAGQTERMLATAHQNFRSRTLTEQQAEMIALMTTAPGREDPFEHLMVSPGYGIKPDEEQMARVPARLLELLGAASHLAFVAWHADTDHIHAHIGVCRVDPETGRRVKLGDGWLLDSLAQARAQIEFEEGWPREHEATYRANEQGVFLIRTGEQVRDSAWNHINPGAATNARRAARDENVDRKLSNAARDHELHQRVWSDERAAMLIAWPIIETAPNWDTLHRSLAADGIRYVKEGGGARLWIGERKLAATKANWAASPKKLEQKLGDYRPASEGSSVATYIPRRFHPAEQRDLYQRAKARARATKLAEVEENKVASEKARAILIIEHERLQQQINAFPWVGRVDDLTLARKLAGTVLRNACDDIERDRCHADRAIRDRCRTPRFETWLSENFLSDEEEDDHHDRRNRKTRESSSTMGMIVGSAGQHCWPNVLLPGYEIEEDALEWRYWRDGELRFVDRANRIEVIDGLDRDTVRDALGVASVKWSKVQVTGDRRFRELVADVAAELNIELANPELKIQVAQAKKRWSAIRLKQLDEDRRIEAIADDFLRQWPMVAEENGKMIASGRMMKQFGVTRGTIEHPVFQVALRDQLTRQKEVLRTLRQEIDRDVRPFRNIMGDPIVPAADRNGVSLPCWNWTREPGFKEWLKRQTMAAQERNDCKLAEYETRKRAPASSSETRTIATNNRAAAPARTGRALAAINGLPPRPGWTGSIMPTPDRRALLNHVDQKLAGDEWDPRDDRRPGGSDRGRTPRRARDLQDLGGNAARWEPIDPGICHLSNEGR